MKWVDKLLSDAISALETRSRGEVLHQGVTSASLTLPGVTTRAGRRKSEEGPPTKPRKKQKPITVPSLEEWDESEEHPGASKDSQPQQPPEDWGWMHTLLTDIQKTQREILAKVTTLHAQSQADRQRMANLEMRVESLQKARMAGLTTQSLVATSGLPASGTTPHASDITEGPKKVNIGSHTYNIPKLTPNIHPITLSSTMPFTVPVSKDKLVLSAEKRFYYVTNWKECHQSGGEAIDGVTRYSEDLVLSLVLSFLAPFTTNSIMAAREATTAPPQVVKTEEVIGQEILAITLASYMTLAKPVTTRNIPAYTKRWQSALSGQNLYRST